nr:MAG TPA: hypothetical protein [Caudoviricetes sp.]
MKFMKIKAYEFNMIGADRTYDLYLNLHTVIAFYESNINGNPCIKIELLDGTLCRAPIEEFERLKNNVISPFCGDV